MKGNVKYGILRVTYNNSNPIFSKVVIEGARITYVDDRGNISLKLSIGVWYE